jgi:hypothetical protein
MKSMFTKSIVVVLSLIGIVLLLSYPSGTTEASSNVGPPPATATKPAPQTQSPAVGGSWDSFYTTKDVTVHSSVLPDGRILYWGRDKASDDYDVGGRSNTYLVDPLYLDNVNYTAIPTPTPPTNLFCSGHSFLPDGRLLVTGGHGKATDATKYPGADPSYSWVEGIGEKDINVFDYRTNTWTPMPAAKQMQLGRWYPFNVTTANGETVIMSGTYWDGVMKFGSPARPRTSINVDVSIRDLQGGIRTLPKTADFDLTQFYPYLSLTPENKIFNAKPGPSQSNASNLNHLFDPYSTNSGGTFGVVTLINRPTHDHWEGTSAMYAPGKVLLTGGGFAGLGGTPSTLAETIDLTTASPQWNREVQAGPMTWGRQYATATVLPDGKVLVTGGTNCSGNNNLNCGPNDTFGGAVQTPELWDPANPSVWQQMNATNSGVPRVYHSIAMLLPDGRVLVGGGGLPAANGETAINPVTGLPTLCRGQGPQVDPPECRKLGHNNVEIFSPPYLYNADGSKATRPSIMAAPDSLAYGHQFVVQVGNVVPSTIKSAVLVRLPSVTHTYNQDQRRIDLGPPLGSDANFVRFQSPASGAVCPPGPYMLFLISNNGRHTPSAAKIVRVGDIGIDRGLSVDGVVGQSQSFNAVAVTGFPLSGTIAVSASAGVSWAASAASAGWLTINSGASGTGDGVITYSLTPNTASGASDRRGVITVQVPGRTDVRGLEFTIYQASNFGDVPSTNPFYRFVSAIYARGITAGCGGGNYCPNPDVTRAQSAVFLTQIITNGANVPTPVAGGTGYADVFDNNIYRKFITYMKRRGIASAIPDACVTSGNFCPDQPLTRRDAMVWILRAAGIDNPPLPARPTFVDVPFSDPAAAYIEEGYRRGITAGCGAQSFCPDMPVNRATIAVFLTQVFAL